MKPVLARSETFAHLRQFQIVDAIALASSFVIVDSQVITFERLERAGDGRAFIFVSEQPLQIFAIPPRLGMDSECKDQTLLIDLKNQLRVDVIGIQILADLTAEVLLEELSLLLTP